MTDFTRGSSIRFTLSDFVDEIGGVTTVTSAALRLNYRDFETNRRGDVDVVMTESSGVWTYRWDSAEAQAGTVYWSILAPGASTTIAKQGSFNLVGNAANP